MHVTDVTDCIHLGVVKLKKALASRRLFNNWLSLLFKYALTELGFRTKLNAKIDDCTIELGLADFKMLVEMFSCGLIKSFKCIDGKLYVNGVIVNDMKYISGEVWVWDRVFGWVYDDFCSCWVKGSVRFRHMYYTIHEVFDFGRYSALDVRDKVIVDIGAFVGDSSIYFVLKGARRVLAIEPHPQAYKEMLDNIRLNNLENTVIPVNAGLASKPGKICIADDNVWDTVGKYHKLGECDNVVPAITLDGLIEKHGINGNDAVLRMDCEGCECDVILNDYEHVKYFNTIFFEYHKKACKITTLLKTLSQDYNCKTYRSPIGHIQVQVMCVKKR